MKTMTTGLIAAVMTTGAIAATPATAAVIATRADLAKLLGTGAALETFEAYKTTTQTIGGATLDAATNWSGLGTGMVASGVTYAAGGTGNLVLNVNGYYGLKSHTLGTSGTPTPLTLTYATPVTAFGFDLQGYAGYGGAGTVSVYDTKGALLSASRVQAGYSGASTFFGFENAAGIGKVVVAEDTAHYLMIDNHAYGISAVPEPATWAMMLIGFGGIGATMRHRRRATKITYA